MNALFILFLLCCGMALGAVGFAFALAIADARRENAWRNAQGPIKWNQP